MKKGVVLGVAILLATVTMEAAQTIKGVINPSPDPAAYDASAERGPHHRIKRIVTQIYGPNKTTLLQTNQFTEFAIGMHYLEDGQWKAAEEKIELVGDVAVARKGQHKVTFQPNLNTAGAIDIETPDGKRLRGNIAGLAYYDAATGQSVLLANVKDSVGQLLAPNKIIYHDAFDNISADVIYEYTRAGVSQLVVLRENPLPPEDYNLNSATARLEVWSEFVQPPVPKKVANILRREVNATKRSQMVEPDWVDETLDFGAMQMLPGKAFSIAHLEELDPQVRAQLDTEAKQTRVGKSWQRIEGRDFLIESVEFPTIEPQLEVLPKSESKDRKAKKQASIKRELPSRKMARVPSENDRFRLVASMPPSQPGLVVDYDLAGTLSSYTFGIATYHIIGAVTISGSATFNGGSTLKYDHNASLTLQGPVTSSGATTLTASDDNSVGISLNGDYPIAPCGYYANTALAIYSGSSSINLAGFDIRYAQTGISCYAPGIAPAITGSKFSNCGLTLHAYSSVTFYAPVFCNIAANQAYSASPPGQVNFYSPPVAGTDCADDWPNCISAVTATSPPNVGIAGNIEHTWDEDFFRVQLSSPATIDASTTGSTDTYGYLLDSSGSTITYNDDGQGSYGANFHLIGSSLPAGIYYLRVRHYNSDLGTGAYTLNINTSGGGVNSPPTISGLSDASTPMNTPIAAMSFTINDAETPASSLTLSASSSNPTIIPTGGITFTGSGSTRYVSINPAANQTGNSTITVTVTDGNGATAYQIILVTVTSSGGGGGGGGSGGKILNFNFGGGYSGSFNKTGAAAIGSSADVWNNIVQNATAGVPRTDSGFLWADNTSASGISLTINNAIGIWDSMGTPDPMMNIYLVQQNSSITLAVGGLPAGTYELYLYAHGADNLQYAYCNAVVGSTGYGAKYTGNYSYNDANWQENKQYVKWTVSVASGQNVNLTISPVDVNVFMQSFAAINGLQIRQQPNQAPTISSISNQTITQGSSTTALAFTIGDAETSVNSLTLSSTSSNPTLLPNGSMIFGGSGASRTLTITPSASQYGIATVTVTVSDGAATASTSFSLTVNQGNHAPTISSISNQTINEDAATSALAFTVGDMETTPSSLTLTVSSTNPTLLPSGSMVLGGSGANRTLTVTPPPNQSGTASVTVIVSDSSDTASTSFSLTVVEDGLPLSFEQQYFPNERAAPGTDADGDGLTNLQEYQVSTNPKKTDTDTNGVPDGAEDFDSDGLPNLFEFQSGTNPLLADAESDPDGDGYPNWEEFLLNQNPIVANPARAQISLAAIDATMSEPGVDIATVRFSRTGSLAQPLTINYRVSGSARNGTDYQTLSGELTFAVNQSTVDVIIRPLDDTLFEGTETVDIEVRPSLRYAFGATTALSLNLTDNDKPTLSIQATDPVADEETGDTGQFTIKRTGEIAPALTVPLTISGTAANGTDYSMISASVTFAEGEYTKNISVSPLQDSLPEAEETVIIAINANSAYIVSGSPATVTIRQGELPVITVAAQDSDARESGLDPGTFRFTRTGSTTAALTVRYHVGGTAISNTDYAPLALSVVIPVGSASADVTVTPLDDAIVETSETVIATIAGDDKYAIGVNNSATVFIDDKTATSYDWSSTLHKQAAVYNASPLIDSRGIVEVKRWGSARTAASFPVTIYRNDAPPAVAHGEFHIGGDYSNGNLVFAANQITARFEIGPLQSVPAGTTQEVLVLIPGIFGAGGGKPVHFLPAEKYVEWQVVRDEAIEGGQTAVLRLLRPGALLGNSILDVPVSLGGRASSGVDYNQPQNVTLSFPIHGTQTDLTLSAVTDSFTEGWELVTASINPQQISQTVGLPVTRAVFIRESAADPLLLADGDADNDGLPDHWEYMYGLNPLVADEPTLDLDKDGLTTLEEFLAGTNPSEPDSDFNGVNDYVQMRQANLPSTESIDIKLVSGDSGKLNNGQGCAVCHTSILNVGDFKVWSPTHGTTMEKILRFKKGQSYPVRLTELTRDLPPTGASGTPTTTAKYTAQLVTIGNKPNFIVTDSQSLLGTELTWNATTVLPKQATMTVPKVELSWQPKGDNLAIEDNTNPSTGALMEGGGKRIYVGAKTPVENLTRNTAQLKIKVTPALPGRTIYLRAIDVDDRTPEDFDAGAVIDSNGKAGDDNYTDYLSTPKTGVFIANNSANYSTTLNSSSEALVEFKVGMQPGNNYRVAVSLFSDNNLASLQVADANAAFYVPADDSQVTAFNGDISPMLTVWRKLHLEIDSMMSPPPSGTESITLSGVLNYVKLGYPKTGNAVLRINDWHSLPYDRNRFENGFLTVQGIAIPLKVIGSDHETFVGGNSSFQYVEYITVQYNGTAEALKGKAFTLRDDDDQGISEIGALPNGQSSVLPRDHLHVDDIARFKTAFILAYINLEDANQAGLNPRPRFSFVLNRDISTFEGNGGIYADNKDLFDTRQFWAHTLSYGYQPFELFDNDPDQEEPLRALTAKRTTLYIGGVSAVFLECVREAGKQNILDSGLSLQRRTEEYYRWLSGIVVHELGHGPGGHSETADHAEGEVMSVGATQINKFDELRTFSAISIKRFRSAFSWSE